MIDIMFFSGLAIVFTISYLMVGWFTAYFINDYIKNKLIQQQIKLCILVSFFMWPLVWIIVPIVGLKELYYSK